MPSIAAGVARSRRYTLSAAFVASGAALACGVSSRSSEESGGAGGDATGGTATGGTGQGGTGQGGTGQGGTATGGTGQGGNATGGTATGGTATGGTATGGTATGGNATGGTITIGGSAGSAAAAGVGGGTLITGTRACADFEERPGCRSDGDCPPPVDHRSYRCTINPRTSTICAGVPVTSCPSTGCAPTASCRQIDLCNSACFENCNDASCNGTHHCVGLECVALPCDEPGAPTCPADYACNPSSLAQDHCDPIRCEDGTQCETWRTCSTGAFADEFQCALSPCVADEDCGGCGYCVTGYCQPNLAVCELMLPAMPYGCVWPDEELV